MIITNFKNRTARCSNRNVQNSKVAAKGFTLIELLIVVAIIGLLSAIAYPSYQEHTKSTRRADGHVALMNAVQFLERCKAANFSFTSCTLPANLTESDESQYAISLTKTATTYTLTATAQDKQANDSDCSTITINDKGQKGSKGIIGSTPCW